MQFFKLLPTGGDSRSLLCLHSWDLFEQSLLMKVVLRLPLPPPLCSCRNTARLTKSRSSHAPGSAPMTLQSRLISTASAGEDRQREEEEKESGWVLKKKKNVGRAFSLNLVCFWEQNRLIIQCLDMLHIVVHQYRALCYISDAANKNISRTGSNQIIQSVKGNWGAGPASTCLFGWEPS